MGRKPNALISRYFERGRKLQDNSNRYGQTCRLCKMRFPKGRRETLMRHLVHQCQLISNRDRVAVCLEFNKLLDTQPGGSQSSDSQHASSSQSAGFALSSPGLSQSAAEHTVSEYPPTEQAITAQPTTEHVILEEQMVPEQAVTAATTADTDILVDVPAQNWNGLETLAEASRQVDMGENHIQDQGNTQQQQQFALEHDDDGSQDRQSFEERQLVQYLGMNTEIWGGTGSEQDPNLSTTAAAATARLLPTMLESHLQNSLAPTDHSPASPSSQQSLNSLEQHAAFSMTMPDSLSATSVVSPEHMGLADSPITVDNTTQLVVATVASAVAHPWEQPNIITSNPQAPIVTPPLPSREALPRGGSRMDMTKPARCKFEATRRQEVRKNRQSGACWRCRLLRKPCDSNLDEKCGTCQQVVNPRVWRWGCVRARLSEKLDLYSVGIHAVMCRKQTLRWTADPSLIRRDGIVVTAGVVVERDPDGTPTLIDDGELIRLEAVSVVFNPRRDLSSARLPAVAHPVMFDAEKEDLPVQVETYAFRALSALIRHEPSHFARSVLVAATQAIPTAPDVMTSAVLQRVLSLWTQVEMMDREADWHLVATPPAGSDTQQRQPYVIRPPDNPDDGDLYALFSMQLSEAAERKATAEASEALKNIQTLLLDAHVAVGLHIFLAVLVLLLCVERTTWALRAWERPGNAFSWPLDRPLDALVAQGRELVDLLRKVMSQRKMLVKAEMGELHRLVIREQEAEKNAKRARDKEIVDFVNGLMLSYHDVERARDNPRIDYDDPRSLELSLCSHILMPSAI